MLYQLTDEGVLIEEFLYKKVTSKLLEITDKMKKEDAENILNHLLTLNFPQLDL